MSLIRKSSKSSSKTENNITTQNAGFSDISGDVSAIQGSGNAVVSGQKNVSVQGGNSGTLNLLDGGAIAEAFSFATDFSTKATASISESVKAVQETARTENENVAMGFQKIAWWGLLMAGVVFGIKFWRGS